MRRISGVASAERTASRCEISSSVAGTRNLSFSGMGEDVVDGSRRSLRISERTALALLTDSTAVRCRWMALSFARVSRRALPDFGTRVRSRSLQFSTTRLPETSHTSPAIHLPSVSMTRDCSNSTPSAGPSTSSVMGKSKGTGTVSSDVRRVLPRAQSGG